FWNRCYEPRAVSRDTALKSALSGAGVEVQSFHGSLLAEPWEIATGSGNPYKVFTPFWRALSQRAFGTPLATPEKVPGHSGIESENLGEWNLRPSKPDWAAGLREEWSPGEAAARAGLSHFVDGAMAQYREARDRPGREGTSRLSP